MDRIVRGWMVAGLLLGTMTYAIAEDVTLTTYYPSPRGVYEELRSNKNTYLAIQAGNNVGIGDTSASEKLDVNGNALVRGTATVTGTITIQGGGPAVGRVLTSDGSGNASWAPPTYQ